MCASFIQESFIEEVPMTVREAEQLAGVLERGTADPAPQHSLHEIVLLGSLRFHPDAHKKNRRRRHLHGPAA